MKACCSRLLDKLWIRVATFDLKTDRILPYRLQAGDEERLMAVLVDLNAALTRAARLV